MRDRLPRVCSSGESPHLSAAVEGRSNPSWSTPLDSSANRLPHPSVPAREGGLAPDAIRRSNPSWSTSLDSSANRLPNPSVPARGVGSHPTRFDARIPLGQRSSILPQTVSRTLRIQPEGWARTRRASTLESLLVNAPRFFRKPPPAPFGSSQRGGLAPDAIPRSSPSWSTLPDCSATPSWSRPMSSLPPTIPRTQGSQPRSSGARRSRLPGASNFSISLRSTQQKALFSTTKDRKTRGFSRREHNSTLDLLRSYGATPRP